MNILLVLGLLFFACSVVWIYILFMTSSIKEAPKKEEYIEPTYGGDVLERCRKLYSQGLFSELQRYAQRELSKNYGDIELRRILAQSLMAQGNEQLAIMHYEAILSIAHYDRETLDFLASYYCEHGPKTRAIELYEQILLYDAGSISAVENLAKLYEEIQNYEKSAQMYNLLVEAEVDESKAIPLKYMLADLYIKMQDNAKAYETYKQIYSSDPDNLEVLVLLADLAYKNGYSKECLEYYQKIIQTVGDDFEILEKIAQLQVTLENWQEAIQAYKKIISLEDSKSANYLYHQNELCNAMLKNGQYSEAIDLLKDLVAHNPKETSFAFTLASAYTLMGEFQVGVEMYNKLLEVLPPDQSEIIVKYISNLICSWAQDLFKKGEYNLAFDKFFEALKYNEDNDDVYYQLGRCNYYIKSFQDAVGHFKKAITIKPQDSRYYYGLGCVLDAMGSYKNAEAAFYDAININPADVQARIGYAVTLTKELEYAKSIEQFLEVLKYTPDDADTIYNLALAYELVGDIERAIKFYKKAIDVDKNHKEARHNLELLLGEPYQTEEIEYVDENNSEEAPDSEFSIAKEDSATDRGADNAVGGAIDGTVSGVTGGVTGGATGDTAIGAVDSHESIGLEQSMFNDKPASGLEQSMFDEKESASEFKQNMLENDQSAIDSSQLPFDNKSMFESEPNALNLEQSMFNNEQGL